MKKANNLDSFNSASPLFSDLSDDQAAQVSGGFVSEIYLNDQQAQGLLGDSFDSQDTYSFVAFDFNEDNLVVGDDYFIDSYFSEISFSDKPLQLTPEQTRQVASQFGFGDNINQATLFLSADGIVTGVASPAISSRSTRR